ncbi:hypothetical protein ABFX02_11G121400 [Erythranthe guttata]
MKEDGACGACKHQKRKCTPGCALRRYFPANQPPNIFQCVHRLFGVSNVTKILQSLQTEVERDDAMQSIIFESKMREQFPVEGCTRVIRDLQLQLYYALQELNRVHAQLAACRNLRGHLFMNNNAQPPSAAAADVGPTYFESRVDPQYLSSEHPPSTNWLPGSTHFEPGSGSGSSSMPPPPPPPPPQANYSNSAIQQQMGSLFGIPRRRDQDFQESVMKSTLDETLSLQIGCDRIEEASSSFGIQQFPRHDQDSDETGDEADEQETVAD